VKLVYDMQGLALDSTHRRFFGKSSGAALATTARDIKKKYAEMHEYGDLPKSFGVKRPQFWIAQPWVRTKIQTAKDEYDFPEQGLLCLLIDKYFTHVNAFLPLLHRPTFENDVSDGLHLRNGGFGGVVSLVCALGSRHTDDPRVLLPGTSDVASAGWSWFEQVQLMRNSGLAPASIHEIQSYSVRVSLSLHCYDTEFLVACRELLDGLLITPSVLEHCWHWIAAHPGCRCTSKEGVQTKSDRRRRVVEKSILVFGVPGSD